ncbi:hypothetical protein Lnau_2799 [Legionella nautarum]|uniref:Uncharacterized protein n=1 Tax=Legionella nautarum TaxID=45070 RepID=A0A0W0WLG2_9GAMM|nr:hypothetical protein [Legionella nautarum]KTD33151.1 hypothetical protein Lnau_2799 [Legionella nautarum]
MQSEQEVKNLIARDKSSLSKFIFDLCGFTLDRAGYDPQVYRFYLHVAFRHQATCRKEEWDALCRDVGLASESKKPLNWDEDNKVLHDRIVKFAQTIVNEVSEASQDNWAVKLIKTSYLHNLDRVYVSCERLINHLEEKSDEESSPADKAMQAVLQAQVDYLDSLSTLPFVLEKICLKLANNKGINYQPRKTAEMLAASLDTINAALSIENRNTARDALTEGLKLAIKITMPDLPMDSELLDAIQEELPTFNKIIKNTKKLEEQKKLIFPKNRDGSDSTVAVARKQMLAALEVNFDSLTDILTKTLLEPVRQCKQVVADGKSAAVAITNAVQDENLFNRLGYISEAFRDFDKITSLCAGLEETDVLPAWLMQANVYYTGLKGGGSKVHDLINATKKGLGAFFSYAISYIPESVSYYLSRTDALTRVLNEVALINEFPIDKIIAYVQFYELTQQGKIEGSLKAKFFNAYMQEVVKASEGKLKLEEFNFEHYQRLETKIEEQGFNIYQSLAERIKGYAKDSLSDSFIMATNDAFNIQPLQLDILALINRLQTLERQLDVKDPTAVFQELTEAATAIADSPHDVHKVFGEEFFQPAIKRMFEQYQNKQLASLLEQMLDSHELDSDDYSLRTIYKKLNENLAISVADLTTVEEIWIKYQELKEDSAVQFKNQMASVKELTRVLGNDKEQQPSKEASAETPNEKGKKGARATIKKVKPTIRLFLNQIQDRLEEQKKSCKELKRLAENKKIADLCDSKLRYINALSGLITRFQRDFRDKGSKLNSHLILLLNGELTELAQQSIESKLQNLSITSFAKGLFNFVWNILPPDMAQMDEKFLAKLIAFYLANAEIDEVRAAEAAYSANLNRNPIPALMKELSDPLAVANILPSQEKMMDALVDNLIEIGGKTAFSWGTNFLKKIASQMTQEQLIRFLPYPFLAELALQAIKSDAVQAQVAPIMNHLVGQYGGALAEKANEFKELAKNRLYPILGIEIQKTIEANAFHYATNPNEANETERDSFAMYYLQYREIIKNGQAFDRKGVIQFLFPGLLAKKKEDEKEAIIASIANAFTRVDGLFKETYPLAAKPLEETNQQLQFLIEHVDLADNANDSLIKLALVNRLLIMTMDASSQLGSDVQEQLQQQAINKVAEVLNKIKAQAEREKEVEQGATSEEIISALNAANNRARKLQLSRVQAKLAQAEAAVATQIAHHEELLKSPEPRLGLSVLEWEYHKSFASRKIVAVFSFLLEFFSFVSTWLSIISPLMTGGFLQALLVAIGVGTGATGIGAAVVGAFALMRLAYKFGMEIYKHKDQFLDLNDNPSLMQKIGKMSLLVLKCFGLALAKTIFTDFIVAKVSTLLAFSMFESIRNAFRIWPKRDRVEQELAQLNLVKGQLTHLTALLNQQVKFIEKKVDEQTKMPFRDQSEAIEQTLEQLQEKMAEVEAILKIKFNDARKTLAENYTSSLESLVSSFANLQQEVAALQNLQKAQMSFLKEETVEEPPEPLISVEAELSAEPAAVKAVVIDLNAYKQQLGITAQAASATQAQAEPISNFWQRINPWAKSPNAATKEKEQEETELSSSDLDFVLLRGSELLNSSIFTNAGYDKVEGKGERRSSSESAGSTHPVPDILSCYQPKFFKTEAGELTQTHATQDETCVLGQGS